MGQQHRQQRIAGEHPRSISQHYHQRQQLTTTREEGRHPTTSHWRNASQHRREGAQQHQGRQQQQQDGVWQEPQDHRQSYQQERRWHRHQGWRDWQHQQQFNNPSLHQPIGAGREWDNYILQRQQGHSSSTRPTSTTRSSASTWARQQDGGHRTRIHLNVIHLDATWHIASWSSASTKMSVIILPRDPRVHHDLLPDILSRTIAYILDINLPRIELKSHIVAALHPVPPGVARQSQKNIRVTLRHLDLQPPPRQHHRDLINHLRCYLGSYQALRGRILASCDPDDVCNPLITACQQYIEQLPPRHPTRAADQHQEDWDQHPHHGWYQHPWSHHHDVWHPSTEWSHREAASYEEEWFPHWHPHHHCGGKGDHHGGNRYINSMQVDIYNEHSDLRHRQVHQRDRQ